jgi:hypothetical protein
VITYYTATETPSELEKCEDKQRKFTRLILAATCCKAGVYRQISEMVCSSRISFILLSFCLSSFPVLPPIRSSTFEKAPGRHLRLSLVAGTKPAPRLPIVLMALMRRLRRFRHSVRRRSTSLLTSQVGNTSGAVIRTSYKLSSKALRSKPPSMANNLGESRST